MSLPIPSPNKRVHRIRKRRQPKQIPALLRRRSHDQRGSNRSFERSLIPRRPARQPRSIDNDVNLLRALDLKYLRDRPSPPRGSLPMNLIERIARQILPQLFKLPSAPDLPQGVHATHTLPQSLQIVIAPQVRISANLHRNRVLAPNLPHPPRRQSFEINRIHAIKPSPIRRPLPYKLRSLGRQFNIGLLRLRMRSEERR